jgi:hypothetical protein
MAFRTETAVPLLETAVLPASEPRAGMGAKGVRSPLPMGAIYDARWSSHRTYPIERNRRRP